LIFIKIYKESNRSNKLDLTTVYQWRLVYWVILKKNIKEIKDCGRECAGLRPRPGLWES